MTEGMETWCSCPHIRAGNLVFKATAWNDACPEHGVGTPYFQALPSLPYGYGDERATTREEWLAFLAETPPEDE